MTKEHILSEIRRAASENGGVPLGQRRFLTETGIATSDWEGKYWVRWSDAVREAGLQPNQLTVARTDDDLLSSLAAFVRELGHFPVKHEINMRARAKPGFPWDLTFARVGRKAVLVARLQKYCQERGDEDVAAICAAVTKTIGAKRKPDGLENSASPSIGYVYLVRHGSRQEYKIGRTNNPIRREGELRTELPEQLQPVHKIATDDPAGIEKYWHSRFSEKRKNGEWFALSADDVQAFKRWRKIY
jgi:Meiotically up-regulated gene 113